jgi:oxygen-dependent protoporphyrinogen oxidase
MNLKTNQTFAQFKPGRPYLILGAGASGLFMGHYLKQKNIPFEIWDCADRAGGKIGTKRTSWGLIEQAANGILQDELVKELCQALAAPVISSHPKLKRLILDLDSFYHRPSAKAMLSLLWNAKRKMTKPNHEAASLSELMLPWLGENRSKQFLSAMTRGIYGAAAYELNGTALFPEWSQMSHDQKTFFHWMKHFKSKMKGAKTISFDGGMQTLIDLLTDKLRDHLHLNKKVETSSDLDWSKNIIFATSPTIIAKILKNKNAALANQIENITYLPLSTTTLFTSAPIKVLQNCFGALITPRTSESIFGVLANSEIFANRTHLPAKHSYTIVHAPSAGQPEIEHFLVSYFQFDLKSKIQMESLNWPQAIPHYNHELLEVVQSLPAHFDSNELGFNGAFIGPWIQIGLRDILTQAKNISLLAN